MADSSDTSYELDVAVGKRQSGVLPLYTRLSQLNPSDAAISFNEFSGTLGSAQFKDIVVSAKISWGLNRNPLVHFTIGVPQDRLNSVIDFPGFTKNSVVGLRFRKEKAGQATPWVYGVTQHTVPMLDNERMTVAVDGYGLLFEAPRRHVSRRYGNSTAKGVISTIVKKYGLQLEDPGSITDLPMTENEQNFDDFSMLTAAANFLNAFWYLEEHRAVLIGRDAAYRQSPAYILAYGNRESSDAATNLYPLFEFVPRLTAQSFEAGALGITARGVDLDTGEVVQKSIVSRAIRLGSLSLNSKIFLSDDGTVINGQVVRPAPMLASDESGLFLPLRTRSIDEARYQYAVEQKDFEVVVDAVLSGFPAVRPGMVVRIEGVGNIFGGNYMVWEVNHLVGRSDGFKTRLTLVRNAVCNIISPQGYRTNPKKNYAKSPVGRRFVAQAVGK